MLRTGVGVGGIGLAFVLVVGDGLLFDGDPFPRDSISAYYYTGVRDLMVGAICSTGVFLLAYKVAERNLDNTLSVVAGGTALAAALAPPRLPAGVNPSPLQDLVGQEVRAWTHFITAVVFIISLAVLSFFFGVREGQRPAEGKAATQVLADLPLGVCRPHRCGAPMDGLLRAVLPLGTKPDVALRRDAVALCFRRFMAVEGARVGHASRPAGASDD